ncbi:unnamed protein product [Hydatigera taeniaeformis]|uniref:DUF148 domain-containing protein n=1 Tax=Hydatigena taeniaeformis TaxID=6205 RepID=A0A0R3X6P5_HYDTA|nr:unnamed protein product [Hydatigera taeniaeformis]
MDPHHTVTMRWVGVVVALVVGCLVVNCIGYPKQPTFPSCQSAVCSSDGNTQMDGGWVDLGEVDGAEAEELIAYMKSNNVPMYALPNGEQVYANHPAIGRAIKKIVSRKHPQANKQSYPPPSPSPSSPSVYNMDPVALQSLLLNTPYLNQLVMFADPVLLQSALMHVRGIGNYAASMDPHTLQSMIAWTPSIKEVVASMNPALLKTVLVAIPNIDSILLGTDGGSSKDEVAEVPSEKVLGEEAKAAATTSVPATTTSESVATTTAAATAKSTATTVPQPTTSEKSDETTLTDPNPTQLTLSAVPNIPPQYANVLLGLDAGFVQYIVENHQDPSALLTNMSAQTLQYVAAHVPTFGAVLSSLPTTTLEEVFGKLSNIAECLQAMDYAIVKELVAKLPWLAVHAPAEPLTTATPTTPTPQSTVQTTIVTEPPTFTDNELAEMRKVIPLIDKLLVFVEPEKLAAVRSALPTIANTLRKWDASMLETINVHLANATSSFDFVFDSLFKDPLPQVTTDESTVATELPK